MKIKKIMVLNASQRIAAFQAIQPTSFIPSPHSCVTTQIMKSSITT